MFVFLFELQQKQSSGDKVYKHLSFSEVIEYVSEAFLKQDIRCTFKLVIQGPENSIFFPNESLEKAPFLIQEQILVSQYPWLTVAG